MSRNYRSDSVTPCKFDVLNTIFAGCGEGRKGYNVFPSFKSEAAIVCHFITSVLHFHASSCWPLY